MNEQDSASIMSMSLSLTDQDLLLLDSNYQAPSCNCASCGCAGGGNCTCPGCRPRVEHAINKANQAVYAGQGGLMHTHGNTANGHGRPVPAQPIDMFGHGHNTQGASEPTTIDDSLSDDEEEEEMLGPHNNSVEASIPIPLTYQAVRDLHARSLEENHRGEWLRRCLDSPQAETSSPTDHDNTNAAVCEVGDVDDDMGVPTANTARTAVQSLHRKFDTAAMMEADLGPEEQDDNINDSSMEMLIDMDTNTNILSREDRSMLDGFDNSFVNSSGISRSRSALSSVAMSGMLQGLRLSDVNVNVSMSMSRSLSTAMSMSTGMGMSRESFISAPLRLTPECRHAY